MSHSHVTVLKPSYFLWGSLAWCRDRSPAPVWWAEQCWEQHSALRAGLQRCSLAGMCCCMHCALHCSRDLGSSPIPALCWWGDGFSIPASSWALRDSNSTARGSCISHSSHRRVFSPEHTPNRATKSCFLTTGLSALNKFKISPPNIYKFYFSSHISTTNPASPLTRLMEQSEARQTL